MSDRQNCIAKAVWTIKVDPTDSSQKNDDHFNWNIENVIKPHFIRNSKYQPHVNTATLKRPQRKISKFTHISSNFHAFFPLPDARGNLAGIRWLMLETKKTSGSTWPGPPIAARVALVCWQPKQTSISAAPPCFKPFSEHSLTFETNTSLSNTIFDWKIGLLRYV